MSIKFENIYERSGMADAELTNSSKQFKTRRDADANVTGARELIATANSYMAECDRLIGQSA